MDFDKIEAKLKELWADPKSKSAIKLGIYILIAIIALVYARASFNQQFVANTETEKKLTVEEIIENFKDLSNFKATYELNGNKYIYTYVNKELLKIGTNTYYITDGKLVDSLDSEAEVPKFDYDFWYITPSYISNLFMLGEEQYVKNFNSGKVEKGYSVELQDFVSTFDGVSLDIDDVSVLEDKTVEIVVTVFDNKVIGINMDLSSFYNLIDNEKEEHKLSIYYE